jgi:hypothetical protein
MSGGRSGYSDRVRRLIRFFEHLDHVENGVEHLTDPSVEGVGQVFGWGQLIERYIEGNAYARLEFDARYPTVNDEPRHLVISLRKAGRACSERDETGRRADRKGWKAGAPPCPDDVQPSVPFGVSSCSRKEHAENHTGGLNTARGKRRSGPRLKSHHSGGHSFTGWHCTSTIAGNLGQPCTCLRTHCHGIAGTRPLAELLRWPPITHAADGPTAAKPQR